MFDLGRVQLRTSEPLCIDPYRRNREMGSLILIDPRTNETLGGVIVRG